MSYCRWSEGDLYAYRSSEGYIVHVAAKNVGGDVGEQYLESSAHALLARILWLGSKGCHYPWDALRSLKDDIIAEIEEQEVATRESA
jgi:hypothetical protein